MKPIRRAAVLGAGVMGAGIAVTLADAGVDVLLLDMPARNEETDRTGTITPNSREERNRLADTGLSRAMKTNGIEKPQPVAARVTTGNFEDDIAGLSSCDWVIEAVLEDIAVKKRLFQEKVIPNLSAKAVLSTNTSGLSVNEMAAFLPNEVRPYFLATHFFNPPRRMRLLELVPSSFTNPAILDSLADFCHQRLGKGIVLAKDTPNFIANRIGVFSLCNGINHMARMGLSIEEVDGISGEATARPATGLARLFDLVGIDTMKQVADNSYRLLPEDDQRSQFKLPAFIDDMITLNLIGRKAGAGFYRKNDDGQTLCYDYRAGEYRPFREPGVIPAEWLATNPAPENRLKAVMARRDPAAVFAWRHLRDTLLYAVKCGAEIADDVVNIDNAMKWGYNWALGPFEMLDILGPSAFCARVQEDGLMVPELLQNVEEFYLHQAPHHFAWSFRQHTHSPLPFTHNQTMEQQAP